LLDDEKKFGLVADDIGGSAGGDIASHMFADIAKNVFTTR
jgi:serine/threonine protein phosphatase PrpC